MARKRGLSEGERKLWSIVARSTTPLHKQDRPAPPPPAAPPEPATKAAPRFSASLAPPGSRIAETRMTGKRSLPGIAQHDSSPAQRLAGAPLRMDAKTHKRMKQGRLQPEARLDLHGMTLSVAHPALIGFVLSSQAAGMRLVLVITGKGRGGGTDPGPLPRRPGALRHSVPHWLQVPPLSGAVQQVAPAHHRHGGEGAYYVYLRRTGRHNT